MKPTSPQVKNAIRRGLRSLVDPEPRRKNKEEMWAYFNGSCAYCGNALARGEAHLDHLFSAARGGANGIANRVLSCNKCNAIEKRERDWTEFLREKAESESVFGQRKDKIDNWVRVNGGHATLEPELLALIEEEGRRIARAFDEACQRIRQKRDA